MTERVVVVGAGGFGRETLDVIAAINADDPQPTIHLVGVLDDAPSDLNLTRLASLGVEHLGSIENWLDGGDPALFAVAIGSPSVRAAIAARFESRGATAVTLIHPSALLGSEVQFGDGVIVCAGAVISTNVRIGNHAHVNPHVTIGHDTELGGCVSVNPAATISGDVTVGSGALIGAGAVILEGLKVGSGSIVGASACVVRSVPDGVTVKGVPAR
ncbi:NeuD/PglB/VioB family sugar acetyltransferase [Salinibacterium sp. SWN1162]|uniref:NeuD/PglB/VioB family sugar acetyltransferase n=1 Tax=Salinibacterium sp. SWN1162 TaxID=2792053 RepID=UPI0018CD63CB|nr:NeuD/PglB/VioB family sugar acetyltransferase [Salinibacterium sp. SWN1162]MBH0008126.1 NeuD/PglB/VioB family sugar acetyltransferase [Salinibacterium sp. SWN1162]